MNETLYTTSYLIGVEEHLSRSPIKGKLRNITLLALLNECGCLANIHGIPIPQREIDEIKTLSVVWKSDGDAGDIDISQVYNYDTGEVYWEDPDIGDGFGKWTKNDEKLVCSLLMWGNVEQTTGELY
jgi:hypothetical protein